MILRDYGAADKIGPALYWRDGFGAGSSENRDESSWLATSRADLTRKMAKVSQRIVWTPKACESPEALREPGDVFA